VTGHSEVITVVNRRLHSQLSCWCNGEFSTVMTLKRARGLPPSRLLSQVTANS
jgi:hypothetical protein